MEEEAAFALAYNGHQQYRMGCIPLFLKPHMWFFSTIELVLSLFGLIFNCAVTVAIYYSIPLSIIQRRSLATLAVNYACISGLHLSRNIFYLVAFHYPCITIVTTINCKLQEFPLVFLYIHGSVLPIILAIQAFLKHKKNHSIISWTNACTIQQTSILILCVFLSLLFTAFDEDKSHEELLQCTIVMALKDKDMTFWLITTLIFGHAAALILIQIVVFCFHKPITFRTFFNQSLRDYFVIESLSWEILLLLTGVFAVYEFVALELCEKEDGSPWESIRMLIAAMVGRQALVAAALRKISTHAYGSLIARRPCLLNQPIPPGKFYTVIATLFGIDSLIIIFWILLDPLQRKEQRFHLQDPPVGTDEDIKLLPILELCESSHQEMWIALILGYKCLLLVFGLFLAYESRNLKLRYINDSRFVGMAIYNVAILSLVTGPVVTLLIRSQGNANFAFVSITVLLCNFISMGLVFVPKIQHVYKVPQSKDEAAMANAYLRSTISKSDQLRFEQLMKENNELKKQIDIRESRISECRKILQRRLGKKAIMDSTTTGGDQRSTTSAIAKTEITSASLPSTITNNNNTSILGGNEESSTMEAFNLHDHSDTLEEDPNQNNTFEQTLDEPITQSTAITATTALPRTSDNDTGQYSDLDSSSMTSNEILL